MEVVRAKGGVRRKKKITKEGTIPRLTKPYPTSLQKDIDDIKAIVCTPGATDRAITGEMMEATFDKQISGGVDPYLQWLLKTNRIKALRLQKSHFFRLDWINDFLAYWKRTAGKDSYSTRAYALKSIITACKYFVSVGKSQPKRLSLACSRAAPWP